MFPPQRDLTKQLTKENAAERQELTEIMKVLKKQAAKHRRGLADKENFMAQRGGSAPDWQGNAHWNNDYNWERFSFLSFLRSCAWPKPRLQKEVNRPFGPRKNPLAKLPAETRPESYHSYRLRNLRSAMWSRPLAPLAAAVAPVLLSVRPERDVKCDGFWSRGKGCPTARPVKPVSPVPSDIEIAQSVKPVPVKDVFRGAFNLKDEDVFSYGPYKGKINLNIWEKLKDKPNGHYVVVCGINPTPLGEGKSTTTVGLSQALGAFLGQKVLTNIRQPSMGPTFGIKGGAAGGGYAQCFPMEDFNLHMTGDIHAITAAHNLFAAAIDTRYYHENSSSAKGIWNRLCPVDKNGKREFEPTMYARLEKLGLGHKKHNPDLLTEEEIEKFCILDIDPDTITWKRVTDCSDKYLRKVEIGLSPSEFSKKKNEQMKRTSSYGITVSSEIMAILALATDLKDLRTRLGKMICCYSKKGEPITADDFGITGALAVLMMDALPPNTMQTLEGTPALVHAGPFANIAHGNSSIISDLIGLKLVGKDGYVLTEAGFGSDMGGEKFFNIKCYYSGLKPDCAVIVCSVRALKLHSCEAPKIVAGQTPAKEYREENLHLVEKGCANLIAHIQNVRRHGVKACHIVSQHIAEENGAFSAVVAEHHAKGGAGATALGEAVMAACKTPSEFKFLYDAKNDSIKTKILKVVQEVYGGADVKYSEKAEAVLSRYQSDPAISCLPICMSKTQYSLSDDPKKLGAPKGFTITVQDMYVSAGAGFIVVSLGDITFMPGLPIKPAYYKIDLDFSQKPPRVVGLSSAAMLHCRKMLPARMANALRRAAVSTLPKDGLTLADFMPSAPAAAKRPHPMRKPKWLKMVNPNLTPEGTERYKEVRATIKETGLATVCQEARCPNAGECWSGGTATVMIMGDTCTRGCRFCSVATSRSPPPPDVEEPRKVAEAVTRWGVDYIVLTMVDRDDLADQGAAHVAATVRQLKQRQPDLKVETLIGDFQGKLDLVEEVLNSGMDVFAHNVETVERLQSTVRDRRAGYAQSLNVLRHAKQARPDVVTKSSIMLGLGETDEEIQQTLRDLRDVGVEMVTFGQYLQPTKRHMKVTRYVTPEEFDQAMYGLRGINNIYVPNGTGRDSIITRSSASLVHWNQWSQDFNKGKVYSPSVNKSSMAAAGLPCQPPPRSHGPRPLSPARLDGMVKGKRHEVKAPTKRSSSVVERWSQAPGAHPFA
eukprot:s948_g1.t4